MSPLEGRGGGEGTGGAHGEEEAPRRKEKVMLLQIRKKGVCICVSVCMYGGCECVGVYGCGWAWFGCMSVGLGRVTGLFSLLL